MFSYYKQDPSFSLAGLYCLSGGVLFGFAAIITGIAELIQIPGSNKPAMATGIIHGSVNCIIILVFGIIAYKTWLGYPLGTAQTLNWIILKAILVLALFVGNYLGGKLIYKYHIGINLNSTENGNITN
jgi:uncharacterized membrane protein